MRALAAIVAFALFPAPPSLAACFDGFGCTDETTFSTQALRRQSCERLWYMRNAIYDDHGYCFRTDRAAEVFDNSDCYVDDAARIDFNAHEQRNIERIRQAERQKGCN